MLKGALVGHGFIAERGHLPAYREAASAGIPLEIVAICDHEPSRLQKALEVNPKLRVYKDYKSMLAKEAGKIDFVDVTTPPYMHGEIAMAAMDRGLHVLCEKPLAPTFAEASDMVASARKNERVLFPSHNYKHAPVVKAVRSVLDQGLIGPVHLVTLHTFRNTHAKGVNEWRKDWRREKKYSGGGIAMDHGAHTFYLAFDWLGGYPKSITAKMSSIALVNGVKADTEDNLSCSIEFPRGTASAHLTWTAGIRKVIYTLHGERGAIRVEDDNVEVAVMDPASGEANGTVTPTSWTIKTENVSSDWMDASHVTWFKSLLGQFATAVEQREYVGQEARDAVKCIELIETAYKSASQGSRELPLGQSESPVVRLVPAAAASM